MDKIAVFSGALGIVAFLFSIVISLATASYVPFVIGLLALIVSLLWKYVLNELTRKQTLTEATQYLESMQGKEKIEEMRAILEAFEGDRRVYDGAELYTKLLKYYLNKTGIIIPDTYYPKNSKVFEPYGLFLMEVEEDLYHNRPRMYAMLSINGPHAGAYVGSFYAANWNQALGQVAEEGSMGLLPAKLMEVKSPIMKAALESSLIRQQQG